MKMHSKLLDQQRVWSRREAWGEGGSQRKAGRWDRAGLGDTLCMLWAGGYLPGEGHLTGWVTEPLLEACILVPRLRPAFSALPAQ